MSRFWSDSIRDLQPYQPGEQPSQTGLIKLNTNENPYPPSPAVTAAIAAANVASLRLYPDPNAGSLRQIVASYHGLSAEQVFVGNGSDEVLAMVFAALLRHQAPVLFPDISYSFYPVYCRLYGIPWQAVALNESFDLDLAAYRQPCGGIIFPNPNAPTGKLLPLDQIEQLLQWQPDVVVVVDEAYIDFGGKSACSLIDRYPNLLIVQTLSKSRSLAGLRIGLAMGQAPLIAGLERVKHSFNSYVVDRLALAAAQASYKDEAYFRKTCQAVIHSRERFTAGLQQFGFDVLPSAANFVFVSHPQHDAKALLQSLRERGILVRHFDQPRIRQYLRISIGTETECQCVLAALHELLAPTEVPA